MIVFSTVDGHLHKREYEFCFDSEWTEYWKGGFNDLIHQELPAAHETDFQRVQQFTDWRFWCIVMEHCIWKSYH
jgi:hypothetical protein